MGGEELSDAERDQDSKGDHQQSESLARPPGKHPAKGGCHAPAVTPAPANDAKARIHHHLIGEEKDPCRKESSVNKK